MKKISKLPKKILSLFIAVLMIVSSIPFSAVTALAEDENYGYLFSYFTGNGSAMKGGNNTQAIRFALSTNGKDFTPLNSNNPVIAQNKGTQNARDPYMFKGQDGFYYTIATDMDSTSGWENNSQSFVIWKSSDLINWTNETIIDVAQIIGNNVRRAWAPQVIWDASTSKYMVYFALAADGYSSTRMYYMLTDDLLNQASYSMPTTLYDPGADAIDGDIIEQNGVYYLFYKDETTGRKTICLAKSNALKGPYTYVGKFETDSATTGALEGCQVYTVGSDYYLIADRYGDNGKFAIFNLGSDLSLLLNKGDSISTTDSSPITTINATTGFSNLSARHGSVVKINKQQYESLQGASFNPVNVNKVPVDLSSNLVARYLVNNLTTDEISGKYPLSNNSAEWNTSEFNNMGAAYFNGSGAYLQTDKLLEMLPDMGSGFTISFYGNPTVLYNSENKIIDITRFLEINNKGANTWNWADGTGYSYITYRARNGFEVCYLNSANGAARNAGYSSEVNKWHQYTLTYKLQDNKEIITIYCDGVKGASVTAPVQSNTPLYQIGNGYKYLCLGASGFRNEWYTGYLRDVRVYNKAVDSIEAYQLATFYDYDASIKTFEEKMKSGKVYTNMKSAYEAYVNLNKAMDSYYYGQNSNVDLNSYISALSTAVNNMKEWTVTKGNAVPHFTEKSTAVTSSGYANLLYSSSAYNNSVSTTGVVTSSEWSDRKARFEVGHNATVMMYDGTTTPKMPVVLVTQFYKGSPLGGRPTATYACYPSSSGSNENHGALKFTQLWTTNDKDGAGSVDWNFNTTWGGNSEKTGWSKTNLDRGGKFDPNRKSWGNFCQYSNVLEFDTKTTWSNNEYYKNYGNLNWCYVWSEYDKNLDSTMQYLYGTSNTEVPIYVVNIVPLKTALSTAVPELIKNSNDNVSNYKEGGLIEALTRINDATSYNPNSARDGASSASQVASNFEREVSSRVNNLSSLSKTPDDKNQYIAVRALLDNEDVIAAYNNGVNTKYTLKSFNYFVSKYKDARSFMAGIVKDGYTKGAQAALVANELQSAYNNLETPKANITFENLFSFEDFYNSKSAEKGSLTSASFDRANKTMTLVGTNDVSTVHSGENLYMIPVEPGKTYRLELDVEASNDYSLHNCDVMAFLPNEAGTSYDTNYVNWRGYSSSTWRNYNTHKSIEFTIPADYPTERSKIFFRFGTMFENKDDVQQVTATYKNIVFYDVEREAERGNLTKLEVTEISVTPGQKYGDLPSPTREGYVFKGWYTDKEFTNQVTSDSIAVASQTAVNLYAKWHAHNFENQITISKNGNIYTWTGECTCGATQELSKVDASAYSSAVEAARTDIANTVKYSSDSIASLQNVLNNNTLTFENEPVLYQADVETATNNIIHADQIKTENNSGVLVLEKYSIKFNVASVDGKTLATNITGTGTYDYGTMVELDLPQDYQTNYVVTSWKKRVQEVDKVVGGSTTKLYAIVNQEATFTVFVNSIATGDVGGDQAVLTLNNKSGKTVDVGIVETNKEQTVTVNIADSKITIGTVELTAPTYSFYSLEGFYINGTLYSESGKTVTITKDTVITPYYEATKQVNIYRASGETFTINGDNKESYPANWNQKVTLKSETEVYWYNENDVLLGKGTTYSFYANSEITIHTASVVSEQNVKPTASIGYFDYDSTLNKVTVVNNFFVPDRMTVTKAGVILSTKNSTREALIAQTNGKFEGGPESFTSTENQIRISVSRTANTKFTMYALAYVVVDGQTYYANEVKTIDYTPKSA